MNGPGEGKGYELKDLNKMDIMALRKKSRTVRHP